MTQISYPRKKIHQNKNKRLLFKLIIVHLHPVLWEQSV
jgi:hypothetical protein